MHHSSLGVIQKIDVIIIDQYLTTKKYRKAQFIVKRLIHVQKSLNVDIE